MVSESFLAVIRVFLLEDLSIFNNEKTKMKIR